MNWKRFACVYAILLAIGIVIGGLAAWMGMRHGDFLAAIKAGTVMGLWTAAVLATPVSIADQVFLRRQA